MNLRLNDNAADQLNPKSHMLQEIGKTFYANGNQDAGVCIYKNVNDDVYDDMENDNILDHVIHHERREYTFADDDMALTKTLTTLQASKTTTTQHTESLK